MERTVEINYNDAAFSYSKNIHLPKGGIVSCGRIKEETDTYIDVEVVWSESPRRTFFGIAIPLPCVQNFSEFYSAHKGKIVALYWNDVFVYDEEYTGPCKPTPMLTEGMLFDHTGTHVLVHDPETLNLEDAVNHPDKKPLVYCIPKSAITDARLSEENE